MTDKEKQELEARRKESAFCQSLLDLDALSFKCQIGYDAADGDCSLCSTSYVGADANVYYKSKRGKTD